MEKKIEKAVYEFFTRNPKYKNWKDCLVENKLIDAIIKALKKLK